MSQLVWTLANSGRWEIAANWFDVTTGQSANVAPGPADTAIVDGLGNNQFQIIAGPAAASYVEFLGDNALERGAVTGGASFAFGQVTLAPLSGSAVSGAVDLGAGVLLTANILDANNNLEVDGATIAAGAIYQGVSAGGGEVLVLNQAAVTANSWNIGGGSVYVDRTSGITLGAGGGNLGVLNIGAHGTLNFSGGGEVKNAVIDNGTIISGDPAGGLGARIDGTVSGSGQIDVLAASALSLYGNVNGISLIQAGPSASVLFDGGASGIGDITLGSLANVQVFGTLQGTGTINIGAGAYLGARYGFGGVAKNTVTGFAQINLATGATFLTTGGDVGVPISLSGSDKIVLDHTFASAAKLGVAQTGVSPTGPVTGFDSTDVIRDAGGSFLYGVTGIVTAANIVNGTLVLSDDGVTLETVTMPGNFSGQPFVVNSAGESLYNFSAGVYTNVVLAAGPASLRQNAANAYVTGASGTQFDTLNQSGSYSSLYLTGNSAIDGSLSAGAVTFNQAVGTSPDFFVLQAGGVINAGTSTLKSNLEVDGPGAAFNTAGTLVLGGGGGANAPHMFVLNSARVQAGGINIVGAATPDFAGPELVIDPTASVEVGTAGGAALGALTVDGGHTLTNKAYRTMIYGNVVDNGDIEVAPQTGNATFPSDLFINGTLTGNGTLNVQNGSTYLYATAINGLSAINLGYAAHLTVGEILGGDLTSGISLTTGTLSALAVNGNLNGLNGLTTGRYSSTEVFGNASITNAVTVGSLASANFVKNVSGVGSFLLQSGAKATVGGTLSGFSGVTLAQGAAFDFSGVDTAVTLDLAGGQDLLQFVPTTSLAAAITGFDTTDLLTITDNVLAAGGRPITSVAYRPGNGGLGTIALSYDGTLVNSFTLAGNFAGQTFLTNSVGITDGYSDISLAEGSTGIAAGGTVSGGLGSQFLLLAGGSGTNVNVYQDVAVTGVVTAQNITFNPVTLNSGNVATSLAATDILAGAGVTASGTATMFGGLELAGAGATLDAATGIIGNGAGGGKLLILNQAAVQFTNNLTLNGLAAFGTGYQVELDAKATLEVGKAGGAAAGTLTVDAGSTLFADGTNADIKAPVVDNGLLQTGAALQSGQFSDLEIDGNLSGNGQVVVGSLSAFVTSGTVSGITGINIASSASFEAGSATGLGAVTIGNSARAEIYGSATGLSGISVGTLSHLAIYGSASGTGAIMLSNNASAFLGALSDFTGVTVGAGASLALGGVDSGVGITLLGNAQNGASHLTISSRTPVNAVIAGFTFGDSIELSASYPPARITEADFTTLAGGLGKLVLSSDGTVETTLTLAGHFTGDTFLTNAAGQAGNSFITLAEDSTACYGRGTRIRTPSGEVAVEALRPGDIVMTLQHGAQRVRWIGDRRIDIARHSRRRSVMPVEIAPGAFGEGLPCRTLTLSPDHAVFIDGVLIPVRYLINGATICQRADVAQVHYYHVELDRHSVLFADGLPAETYLDTGNRGAFENGGAVQLHPDFAALRWSESACAPLIEDGPTLVAVRAGLAAHAAALRAPVPLEREILLARTGRLRAWVPADVSVIRLVSACTRRGEDRRRLGGLVTGIRIDRAPLALDDIRLGLRFHTLERHGKTRARWTDGAATLEIGRGETRRLIEIEVAALASTMEACDTAA